MQKYAKRANEHRKIALQRIHALFAQASIRAQERPDLARRYVTLARKIATRYQTGIPPLLRRSFCKHCGVYFGKGDVRVRVHQHKLIATCMQCKKQVRIPLYAKKVKERVNVKKSVEKNTKA